VHLSEHDVSTMCTMAILSRILLLSTTKATRSSSSTTAILPLQRVLSLSPLLKIPCCRFLSHKDYGTTAHRSAPCGVASSSPPPPPPLNHPANDDNNDEDDDDLEAQGYLEQEEVEEELPQLSRTKVNEFYQSRDRSEFQDPIEIRMPDIGQASDSGDGGDTTTTATTHGTARLLQWFREPGDFVQPGCILCDVETSDVTFSIEIDKDDPLALLDEIFVPAGTSNIPAGQLLAKLLHPIVVMDSKTTTT
jgi:hypothetical protein